MTDYRLDFSGAAARTFYNDLLQEGLTQSALDGGCRSIQYSLVAPGAPIGAGNHVIRFCELIQGGIFRLSTDRLNPLYRNYSGQNLPWLITNSQTLQRFDQEIAQWRAAHPEERGTTEALAHHIYDWVLDSSGLGVRHDETAPELTADQAIAQQRADCTEFVKILYALLTRAGFSPYPVWVGVDQDGDRVHHFGTAVEIGGRRYLLDPVYSTFNARHRSVTRISLRELLGWHWINIGLDRAHGPNPSSALAAYRRAQEIDPRNPFLYLNRGIHQARQGNESSARADFQTALRVDPWFHPAYYELGNLEFDAGRYIQAIPHYRTAVRMAPREVNCRRNFVLALIHAGRTTAAREHLTALLRLDPTQRDLESLL